MKKPSAIQHTSPRNRLANLLFSLLSLSSLPCLLAENAAAYTEIQPPVTATHKPGEKHTPMFTFNGYATLHSDLRWRGISITDKRPGFSSVSEVNFNRGRFSTFVRVNGYTFSDKPATTGTYTVISSVMTESKVGTHIRLGNSPKSTMALSVAHGIYMWPGADIWQYQTQTCTSGGSAQTYLTYNSSVKPVKSTDLSFTWGELKISYSASETSSSTVTNNDSINGTPMSKDYIHVTSAKHYINSKYSINGEYGYWQNIGRHYGAHINYDFSDRVMGTIKSYNFDTLTSSIEDSYGLAATIQFRFQPEHHDPKRRKHHF